MIARAPGVRGVLASHAAPGDMKGVGRGPRPLEGPHDPMPGPLLVGSPGSGTLLYEGAFGAAWFCHVQSYSTGTHHDPHRACDTQQPLHPACMSLWTGPAADLLVVHAGHAGVTCCEHTLVVLLTEHIFGCSAQYSVACQYIYDLQSRRPLTDGAAKTAGGPHSLTGGKEGSNHTLAAGAGA